MGGDRRGGGRGGEGEWGRRGRSEGGIGKQERGRDGDQKGRRGRKRVEERVGRQEGGGGGRAEEGDGRERMSGNENNTVSCTAVLLTKVVVASPPSPTMSPPSLDCCVAWRWEINEEERIIMLK